MKNVPFTHNDYLLDGLFNISYPGYVGGLWHKDQTRAMTRTPFGDMMDVLTDDAPSWLMQRYDLLIVTSSMLQTPLATANQLAVAIAAGTHAVITANALASLGESGMPLFGVSAAAGWLCRSFPAGTGIALQGGNGVTTTVKETSPFSLCPFQIGAGIQAEVLATEVTTNTSAVVRIRSSSRGGSLTVLLADRFSTASNLAGDRDGNSLNFTCPRPYMNFTDFEPDRPHVMLGHAQRFLSDTISARSLFLVDGVDSSARSNRLSWLVLGSSPAQRRSGTEDGTAEYLVVISNPYWDIQPFSIRPGPALACKTTDLQVEELHVDESERSAPGFAPDGFVAANATDRSKEMSGGSIRVFRVTVHSSASDRGPVVLPPLLPGGAYVPKGRWLRLAVDATRPNLLAAIVARPSFVLHFDGIILDWRYVMERDDKHLQNDADFAAARRLHLAVDATSAIAPFPHWRLCNDTADPYGVGGIEYRRSVSEMSELLRKMVILTASDLLMSLHDGKDKKVCESATVQRLRSFGQEAQAARVRVHIRHSGKASASNELRELVQHVQSTSVSSTWLKVAPSLALLIDESSGKFRHDASLVKELASEGSMMFLLSTSGQDELSHDVTEHASIASKLAYTGAHFNQTLASRARQLLLSVNASLVFDAAFVSHDEELMDALCVVRLLEGVNKRHATFV